MAFNVSSIFEAFICSDEHSRDLFLNIIKLNLSDEDSEIKIIANVNKLMSNAKHRKHGFECLISIIDDCRPSTIEKNALNWVNSCLIKYTGDNLKESKLQLLSKILRVAYTDSNFNRKFISVYLPSIFKESINLLCVHDFECIAALQTLLVIMKYYPSWFTPHRGKVETHILKFLNNENEDIVKSAALAFHYSLQLGNAGLNGLNYKTNYTFNFHKLFRTFSKLINKFCENEIEFSDKETIQDTFEFDDLSNSSNNLHIIVRINNILEYIRVLIKTKFVTAKETRPAEVLEIIIKILSVHKCLSNDSVSLNTYKFSLTFQQIQISVLNLLRLFIYWQQTNLLPFSSMISRIIVDCIEKTQQCQCFKLNNIFQETAYKVLIEWLSISKSSFNPQLQSRLLKCILKDVTPIKSNVTLALQDTSGNKNSKKAKKRAAIESVTLNGNKNITDTNNSFTPSYKINACKLALKTLKSMLEWTKLNITTSLLQELYRSIFNSLITLQSSKPTQLYTDPQCQIGLYEVLVALYCQKPLSVLPPFQITFDILNKGLNDRNNLVANICENGIRKLETKCQAICPSLYLNQLSLIDERDTVDNNASSENEDYIPSNTKKRNDSKSASSVSANLEEEKIEDVSDYENDENMDSLSSKDKNTNENEIQTFEDKTIEEHNRGVSKSKLLNVTEISTTLINTAVNSNSSTHKDEKLITVNDLDVGRKNNNQQLYKLKDKASESECSITREVETSTKKRQMKNIGNKETSLSASIEPPDKKIKNVITIDSDDEIDIEDDSFVDEVIDY